MGFRARGIKAARMTTFKRADTKLNYGSDPLNYGGYLAQLFRIRDFLDFQDLDLFLNDLYEGTHVEAECAFQLMYCDFTLF